MDHAPQPDLNLLDHDALVALIHAHQEEIASLAADRDEQIRRLEAEVDSHRQTLSQQANELSSRSERIEHMKLMIEKLRHMIFGTKSEKIVLKLEQLEFQLEEQETTQAEAEAAAERVSPAKKSKAGSGRKPLPAHLQREEVTHVPQGDCCADCGSQLRKFGEDISEQLEYIPDSFRVIRHIRPKFCCSGCDRVVEAPASSRPIERGLAGPGLLAHVLISKYSDHLPLYRQSEIYARQGIEISRSTLAGWVGAASDLLDPLVSAIQKHVLSGRKVHADDTPIPVLAPGSGKTKTGRLWTEGSVAAAGPTRPASPDSFKPPAICSRQTSNESDPLQQFTQAHLERLAQCGHGAQAGLDQTGVNPADETVIDHGHGGKLLLSGHRLSHSQMSRPLPPSLERPLHVPPAGSA
jgi:transposase